jgi:glucosamine 6-phosphate synthetase-like amidotransferase/phosphosugar isomerase protein
MPQPTTFTSNLASLSLLNDGLNRRRAQSELSRTASVPSLRFGAETDRYAQAHQQLIDEIKAQPDALKRLIQSFEQSIQNTGTLPGLTHTSKAQQWSIIGEGSSFNAINAIKSLLTKWTGKPVLAYLPSDIDDIHGLTPDKQAVSKVNSWPYDGGPVTAISQSGKSASTLNAVQAVKQNLSASQRFPVITVTNNATSPLASLGHPHINLQAGAEQSIAATKSMTNSMMALLLMAQQYAKQLNGATRANSEPLNNQNRHQASTDRSLAALPNKVKQMTDNPGVWQAMDQLAQHIAPNHTLVLLSKGAFSKALPEAALKLTETSSNIVLNYTVESFKHGPKVVVDRKPALIYVVPPATSASDSFFNDVSEHVRAVGQSPEKFMYFIRFKNSMPIPPAWQKQLNPHQHIQVPVSLQGDMEAIFGTTVLFQMLGQKLAEKRQVNPNHPGLTKAVTV